MTNLAHNPAQYECVVLPREQVDWSWPVLRELLAKAVNHGRGEVEVDDILTLVRAGKMFVAVLIEGGKFMVAMAFEILDYPRKSVMNIAFMAGSGAVRSTATSYPFVEDIARVMKVNAIRCSCRESMARYLERFYPDFKRAYIVMEKEVRQ